MKEPRETIGNKYQQFLQEIWIISNRFLVIAPVRAQLDAYRDSATDRTCQERSSDLLSSENYYKFNYILEQERRKYKNKP